MNRTLGWIALVGLGVGVAALALAWMIGGRNVARMIAEQRLGWRSCNETVSLGGPERRLLWQGGDSIEVTSSVALRLTPGSGSEVVMRGTPETIAHLQLRGGRLSSDCHRLGSPGPVDIELPAQALRQVRISGSGKVALEKINQPELALTVNGSGQMRVQGTVDHVSATLFGSADVRLGEVAAKRLTAKISGSGSVEAAPKDEADLTLSGSGTVRLLSRPATLHSKASGSGRILQPPIEAADKK